MPSKPLRSGAISNIKLKRTPANVGSRPLGSIKVDVHAQDGHPLLPKRESSSPPNPVTSAGNKSKPPTQ